MFGGIPWQVYFQRVLSAKSISSALWLSIIAAFGCIFMSIPSVLIGAAGRSVKGCKSTCRLRVQGYFSAMQLADVVDWTALGYDAKQPQDIKESKLILPLVLQYLAPSVVSWVGLGAVSAAVMSSADSSVLSASSMFTRNVYKQVFRPQVNSKHKSNQFDQGFIVVSVSGFGQRIEDLFEGGHFVCWSVGYSFGSFCRLRFQFVGVEF